MPEVQIDQDKLLDALLTLDKLHTTLIQMPNNKAPGPEGFSSEFLKHFWQILNPLFSKMTAKIKNKGQLPTQMNTAAIKVLLTPGKGLTLPSNYCTICLVNTDIKIILYATMYSQPLSSLMGSHHKGSQFTEALDINVHSLHYFFHAATIEHRLIYMLMICQDQDPPKHSTEVIFYKSQNTL